MISTLPERSLVTVYGRRGILARLVYLLFAMGWFLFTGFGHFRRGRVVVLCYHGVTAGQRPLFEWQMSRIAAHSIGVDDISRAILLRRGGLPKVCVTFDDAFVCSLENAVPIMQSLQIPFAVFVVASNLGTTLRWQMAPGHPDAKERVMTADEIVAAALNRLCRFGSHTLTHPNLTTILLPQVQQEIVESKRGLEKLLGMAIDDLALPHGSYNEDIIEAAQAAGYKRIFTLDPHLCSKKRFRGVVGRFLMSPDVWRIEFLLTCAGAYAWLYLWRRLLQRVRTIFNSICKRRLYQRGRSDRTC